MAELDQLARPVMRRTTRLNANQASRQFGKKWQHLRPPKRLVDHNLAGRINTVDLKTFLAKSRPIVVICIADGSHFARERLTAFTLWHPDAVSGSHPPHLLSGGTQLVWTHQRHWPGTAAMVLMLISAPIKVLV